MRVIFAGDTSKARAWVKFTCHECGCVFEAERGEYRERLKNKKNGHDRWFYTECPCCNRDVAKNEVFRREKDEAKEPIYPTWQEWLTQEGILSAGGLWEKAFRPIPADIAEKLGMKPK